MEHAYETVDQAAERGQTAAGPRAVRPLRLDDEGPGERWRFGFPGRACAEVHTRGARLHSLILPDRWGHTADVVLAAGDPGAFEGSARYFGATVGRYANRIAGGRLVVDGVTHRLATQETGHTLHGGPDGFDQRVWRCEPFHSAHRTGVRLFLHSPDGDQGFPGALNVRVTYTLDRDDNLTLSYQAVADAPTIVNLTNHAYWNLEGEGRGNVLAHHLQVAAPLYTPVDSELIPDGPHRSVSGTPFDLRRPRRLSDVLTYTDAQLALAGGGFDHNWVLDGDRRARPRQAAVLYAPASGRRMDVLTTEPGIQVYTAQGLTGDITGKGGRPYQAYAGVALETQHFPDSPNRPDYPTVLLRPGELYRSTTIHSFTTVTA
ncbi:MULTISPECIES: aldose epimerase family protein [unclassified Streptomyces]|uniref:aldose epimerase family protein n=1 Tax=unclassified Streptomyces TaxID=2593676 RepID=UPI002E7FF6E3|nr:aldose epimerase family protein [Streptomyces sp. NBC_00503]WUD85611.1 galactose mutarotase [Streptomyces sp. NBC_00503]